MLWDKKTQLVKQIRSVIDSEVGQAELQMMRAEINYMEVNTHTHTHGGNYPSCFISVLS